MRKSVILLVLAVMTVVTGCDFFRVLAGRPTGKDIDARRVEIMKSEEAALQARLDSIRRAEEKVVADSLAALDSLAAQGVIMTGASRLGKVRHKTRAHARGTARPAPQPHCRRSKVPCPVDARRGPCKWRKVRCRHDAI